MFFRHDIEHQTSAALNALNDGIIDRSSQLTSKAVLAFENELNDSLKSQQALFDAKMREELEKQSARRNEDFEMKSKAAIADMEGAHQERVQRLASDLESLSSGAVSLEKRLELMNDVQARSVRFAQQSLAVREFEAALDGARSASGSGNGPNGAVSPATAVQALRKAFPNDEFVKTVLDTVPAKAGAIHSDGALYARFLVLRDEMRKVALAPPTESTMLGLLIGSVLAKVSSAPSAPIQSGHGVEEYLSRVNYHLEQGELVSALREMDRLGVTAASGGNQHSKLGQYVRVLSEDWKQLVRARLSADIAVRSLKSYVQATHVALAK
jgi:hypothetical protein